MSQQGRCRIMFYQFLNLLLLMTSLLTFTQVTFAQEEEVAFTSAALTIVKLGNGEGQVVSLPDGIDCGQLCTANYPLDSIVRLQATAAPGSVFSGWQWDCRGNDVSCKLFLNHPRMVVAVFTRMEFPLPVYFNLTVGKSGNGDGEIISSPDGINCGENCNFNYLANSTVGLLAVPRPGSVFERWEGAYCTGSTELNCNVDMKATNQVIAHFRLQQFAVDVSTAGAGAGKVVSNPAAINCGDQCTGNFDYDTDVTLEARPEEGSVFTYWSGDCTHSQPTCQLNIGKSAQVTANFALQAHQLSVGRIGNGTGTVTSNLPGINCGDNCQFSYEHNTMVLLTALPTIGNHFVSWSGACNGEGPICTVNMQTAQQVTANFALDNFLLTVSKAGTGQGSVTDPAAIINCGELCQASLNYQFQIRLTAIAATGSTFTGWSGACTHTASECLVSMDQAKNVAANFSLQTYPFTVAITGEGSGTIASTSGKINCGELCQTNVTYGEVVNLTAMPANGSTFAGWEEGPCQGISSSCQVTIAQAAEVRANFALKIFAVNVTNSGEGKGTVSSEPSGIFCGASCSGQFKYNKLVTLTATPDPGSIFLSWGGACSGTQSVCQITIDDVKNVTANFTLAPYALAISRAGTGGGTVSSNPNGINCGNTCNANFLYGTVVVLTATADANSAFTGWSGACAGDSTTCTITIDQAANVTANFTAINFALTISKSGSGSGTITSNPTGLTCGTKCSANFASGQSVTLTATASTGSSFAGWSGACSGTATTCTVAISAATTVTASFNLRNYSLTVALAGTAGGMVTSQPAGIDCGSNCTASYSYSTAVTLTATPNDGQLFTGWSGSCTGTGLSCTVNLTRNRSVTATFDLAPEECTSKSVTLAWDASRDETGVPDERVTGYRVFVGNSSGGYNRAINVMLVDGVHPETLTYTVTGLERNTYFFAVKAFGVNAESDYSNEVSKTFTSCLENN